MRQGLVSIAFLVAACSGERPPEPVLPPPETQASEPVAAPAADALRLFVLDCGMIEISDLDDFSSAGDYAGLTDVFTDPCFLIRHPDGDLLWDLGVPGILAGQDPQEQGIFTISLDRTLSEQIYALGLSMSDIEYVAVSHRLFDHVGQADQVEGSTWLVHEAEYNAMFPPASDDAALNAGQFIAFEALERETFTGDKDVFGDGSVIIFETPGPTVGHTSLRVELPQTGPILLTGDLYHRTESRTLGRVPRFNADEAQTQRSMAAFEALADEIGAQVIIQHEASDIDPLPKPPEALR